MRRIALIVAPFLLSSMAFGDVPEPKRWLDEVLKRPLTASLDASPLRLLLPASLERTPAKSGDFPRLVFAAGDTLATEMNGLFTQKITNQPARPAPDEHLALQIRAAHADAALAADATAWRLLRLDKGKLMVAAAGKPAATLKSDDVRAWLATHLGYDGVVLDQRGDYLLVGSFMSLEKPDTQALLLKDTAGLFVFQGQKKTGAGLAQLVAHDGGIGVFQALMTSGGKKDVSIGTKLTIEGRARP